MIIGVHQSVLNTLFNISINLNRHIDCTVTDDGLIIEGKGIEGQGVDSVNGDINNSQPVFGGGHIISHHDHRIAMSFSVASLRAANQITIEGVETVNTSFPGFAELANQIGMSIQVDTDVK